MKKIYLPKLLNIKVNDYSLYYQQPSFEFCFLDGISAIVGANGIGKTTFVELIMYCIIGHKKKYNEKLKKGSKKSEIEFDNESFFKERMKNKYDKNHEAYVELEFLINKKSITIRRSLSVNRILSLNIDGTDIEDISEDIYQKILISLTQISSFKYIEKIIRNFLFFDELRQNIAWEAETQDEILRILLFEEDFFNQFTHLESEITRLDSIGRHKSEDRRVVMNSLNDLIKEKEALLKANSKIEDKGDINNKLYEWHQKKNFLEDEKQITENELESKIEKYKEKQDVLNKMVADRDAILLKIEEIDENIKTIESKLYSTIYDKLPDFYIILERTLCNQGECLVCGAKSNKLKENSIINSKNSQCLVCSSQITVNEEIELGVIDELNELNAKQNELTITYENILKEIEIIESIVININSEIIDRSNLLKKVKHEIMHIQSMISEHSKDNETDLLTEILNSKQKTIDELSEAVKDAYCQRDIKKNELKSLHNKFKKIIRQLNSSFSQYFNKYASTFLGLKCELTVREKTLNKIPHIIYLPVINNEVRNDIWSVSESQRFFIDQAFRMAIIDYLQEHIDGFETFFITETPEGSLDIAYETKVAEMFIKFSKSLNNIIFTSNLNSSQFLLQLFSRIDPNERTDRILNLLEKGDITAVQEENLPKLYDIYNTVLKGDYNG